MAQKDIIKITRITYSLFCTVVLSKDAVFNCDTVGGMKHLGALG